MRTRSIGSLEVTVVGIGCNNFGRELGADATREIVHAALDQGITFFDTADSYGNPKTASESLLGEILVPHRDRVVIATKFGRVLDDSRRGANAAYVRAATEASLRRLKTDRIDLMQLHIPDPETPIAETLAALDALIKEGKIREIGGSNFSAAQLREMTAAAERGGMARFVSTQTEFSMLHRRGAADILAECDRTGMKLLPFRPLFNGLLTGKYRSGAPRPDDGRIGGKSAEAQARILSPENLAVVESLVAFAEERGHSMVELAFAWLLSHAAVPSVIAGVSSPRQVVSNAAASHWVLTSEDRQAVDELLGTTG